MLPKREVLQFQTADQSRFLLIHDPEMQQVHWAIASWIDGSDDPPGLSGLSLVTAQASLKGTWPTGSLDISAEKEAMAELDTAWQKKMAAPGNSKLEAEVRRRDKVVRGLSDPRRFHRVLAAAPAFHPEVIDRGAIAVTALTTIEPGLPTVAKLLLERREQQALRELIRNWQTAVTQRLQAYMQSPRNRMYAELLALTHPYSPATEQLEAPPMVIPTRDQAMATWQSSQHPTRTVHVLFGSLDLQRTKGLLEEVFTATTLADPTPRTTASPRPLTAQRRSVVPGIQSTGVVLGWVLPAKVNRWALEVGRRWLADESGALLTSLHKARPNLTITCHAPWPHTSDGTGLLVLDVIDPSGKPDLAMTVIKRCQQVVAMKFSGNPYYRSYRSLLHDWNKSADDSRSIAVTMAERALMLPRINPNQQPPPWIKPTTIAATLQSVFASQPAIVEGQK